MCLSMGDRRVYPFDAGAACDCKMPDVSGSRTGVLYERN